MLSIDACKEVLNKNGTYYTDEQVKALRELLYKIAEMNYQHIKKKQ